MSFPIRRKTEEQLKNEKRRQLGYFYNTFIFLPDPGAQTQMSSVVNAIRDRSEIDKLRMYQHLGSHVYTNRSDPEELNRARQMQEFFYEKVLR